MAGALTGFTVVDCSEGVAGGYAGRLLADLGARVVKVEPPGGERLRWLGPFRGDKPDREQGGLHLALNAGKESVVVDLDTPEGQQRFRTLADGADLVLESAGPGVMASRGLGYEALSDGHAALVYASHSPFGSDGPYAKRATSEIVDYAMGGYMYFSGHPERAPLLVPGHQGELHAGMQLACGAVIALWHALRSGAGQHVDVSTFESMLNAHSWLTTQWTHEGEIAGRTESVIIPCADGAIFWMGGAASTDVFLLMDRPDLIADPRWSTVAGWREAAPEVRAMLASWASDKSKHEIYHLAQQLRVPLTPVNTVEDLACSEQFNVRGWWRRVDHPAAGQVELPGPPWLFSETPARVSSAPLLDSSAGISLPQRAAAEGTPGRAARAQPFEGLRVLEVTANWAGPLAGRHFGDMGADVIKFEVGRRPATRGGHPAGREAWTTPYNRSGYFNLFNRNKRDLVMDLSTPQGRELFLRLVEDADVVVENNSARVFPQFGLDYATLAARNPRIVMCSMSGFGAFGPEQHYVAYGANIEASGGLVAVTGYGDGVLYHTGSFYADPITGTQGALGIVAALIARERSGHGQYIDMALQESGAAFQVEAIMDYRLNGRVAGPMNNRSRRIAPQGAYRCAGSDGWVAIGVETDDQWAALASVIGRPELAETFPDVTARLAAQDQIDEAIGAWSLQFDHNRATALLQSAGVPSGPVLANWEIVSDPHLYRRGYFVDVVHPEVGHHRWDGYPWQLSRTPGQVRRPAPLFGEHNDDVLQNTLRLSHEEIAALRSDGVVADAPL